MDSTPQHPNTRLELQRLRSVLEHAPIVLWAIDTDGIFTLSEGRGLSGLGLRPGQVVGSSAFELYANEESVLNGLRRGLGGEEFSAEAEAGDRVFETRFCPIRDDDGVVTGLLGISMDVTARRRAEAEKDSLQAQLLQVQKLESLGLLAGGIAHDFNNILTVIIGGAANASMALSEEHPANADLDGVLRAAQRAADLTRQLLAYAGKGQFQVRPLNLSKLAQEMSALIETTLPNKKVQLRFDLDPNLPTVEADVAQMQQVLMNLVINGAEAIGDDSGTVLVITGVQDIDIERSTSLFTAEQVDPGRYVFVEVHDTGCGMDPETIEKIFDPFFSTKFTGRGLGLAAVLGIARAHGGALNVYSTPGKGSTFKLFLPASDAPAVPRATDDAHFEGQGLALVVDDDGQVRGTVRRMLEQFGYEVLEAADGEEGLERFLEKQDEIALVLLDMMMPKLNGEEVFREIRACRKDVPVVLNSGYNEVEATRRVISKGSAGFIQKPFTSSQLARVLKELVATT